jgi:RecA/RadA recombinase
MLNEMERIKTYIDRLDEQLEGGIPKGSISLICGVAGCMKSSFAYSILYNNAVVGDKKGLYITLDIYNVRTGGTEFEAADGNAGNGRRERKIGYCEP